MSRAIVVLCLLFGAGCGRIGFTLDSPDAAQAIAPSCATIPSICGPAGNQSCCESPPVPDVTYLRSYDLATDGAYGDPSHPATVSAFHLDRYPVTVARFRAFVQAGYGTQLAPPADGAGAHVRIAGSGWAPPWNSQLLSDTATLRTQLASCGGRSTWTDGPAANEARPINCVSWYEAFAFCIWDGAYLPTDAEWNAAAAGGDEQRAYPWSSPASSIVADETNASFFVDTTRQCFGDLVAGCEITDLTPVGSKPAGDGRYGHSDLAGNVYGWLLDHAGAWVDPCVDCAQLSDGIPRVARGGSYRDDLGQMRVGVRSAFDSDVRADVFGFRCARP